MKKENSNNDDQWKKREEPKSVLKRTLGQNKLPYFEEPCNYIEEGFESKIQQQEQQFHEISGPRRQLIAQFLQVKKNTMKKIPIEEDESLPVYKIIVGECVEQYLQLIGKTSCTRDKMMTKFSGYTREEIKLERNNIRQTMIQQTEDIGKIFSQMLKKSLKQRDQIEQNDWLEHLKKYQQ